MKRSSPSPGRITTSSACGQRHERIPRMTTHRPGLRAFWVQVHLWLGLTLGTVGVLIGLSGSILVYDHEIDAQLNPQRYAASGRQVALPYAEYAQRAEAALVGRARATGIRLPDQAPGPVMVFARAKADAG